MRILISLPSSPRIYASVIGFPPLPAIICDNSSAVANPLPPARIITSPATIPASFAGDTIPAAVSTPVVPSTIAPSVKNFTPKAIPPGISILPLSAPAPEGTAQISAKSTAEAKANGLFVLLFFFIIITSLSRPSAADIFAAVTDFHQV